MFPDSINAQPRASQQKNQRLKNEPDRLRESWKNIANCRTDGMTDRRTSTNCILKKRKQKQTSSPPLLLPQKNIPDTMSVIGHTKITENRMMTSCGSRITPSGGARMTPSGGARMMASYSVPDLSSDAKRLDDELHRLSVFDGKHVSVPRLTVRSMTLISFTYCSKVK